MKVVNVSSYGGLDKARRRGVTYCGRPTALGNPVELKCEADRPQVLEQYREWLERMIAERDDPVMDALRELTEDSILGCFCKPKACHCDIIVEIWHNLKARRVL